MKSTVFLSFLLLLLSAVTIFTGCSRGSEPQETPSGQETVSGIVVPPELLVEYSLPPEDIVTGPPVINSITPREGRIGTEIVITGSNFGNRPVDSGVTIGGQALEIISWYGEGLTAKILPGTGTGVISVTTQGGKKSGDEFIIVNETKTLLKSSAVANNADNIFDTESGLTVAIPAGATGSSDQISISSIQNGPVYQSNYFEAGRMYAIEMKSGNSLLKPVALEFELEEGQNPGNTIVCYYEETTGAWVNVPAVYDVNNGKIAVITEHFSHWLLVHTRTGGVFLSDDYFIIAYTPGDTVSAPGVSTIEELAVDVSDYLKKAYLTYQGVLGKEYVRELSKKTDGDIFEKFAQSQAGQLVTDNTKLEQSDFYALADVLNIRDRIIVELSSKHNGYGGSAGFSIKWSQHTIFLPTKYPDEPTLKVTVAHELFHNVQSNTFFSLEMEGFWHKISNKWLIEAAAEYAAWGIAFPESRPVALHEYTRASKPYNYFSNREDGQEYGMSFFVEYALQRGDKDFKNLYRYMVDNRPYIGEALEKYVNDKTGTTISMLYLEFWQGLFTMNNMPKFVKVPDLMLPQGVRNQAELIESKGVINPGTVRAYFSYPAFPDNCENLVVCYAPADGKMPVGSFIGITQVDNFEPNNFNTWEQDTFGERTSNKPKWTLMTETDLITHHYVTFNKSAFTGDKKQAAILVFEAYDKHDLIKMDINYINMEITPKNIDKVTPGEEITFTASLSNIFKQAKNTELVWDFGDGNTEETKFSSYSATIKNSIKHKYSKEGNYTVTVSLFDTTDGRKLIAERVIKLGLGEKLDIQQKPESATTKDEITFSTSGKPGWFYIWELGDERQKDGSETEIKYTYKSEGRYTVKVTAYEDYNMKKVVGFGTINVVIDNKLLELRITPSSNLEASAGDLVEIGVETADQTQSLDAYRIYWIVTGADEKVEDGRRLMLRYEKPGSYRIEVKALDDNGNTMGSGAAVIEIVQRGEDPYRKYDSGFFQYDYSLLYYETGAKTVTYRLKETSAKEGMEIEFFDEALTQPYGIRYYKADMTAKGFWYVGGEEYNEDGTLKYREYVYMKGGVKYTDEYKFRFGVLAMEVHTVNDKLHGPALYFNGNIWGDNPTGQITRTEYYEGKRHGVEYNSFSDALAGTEPSVWYSIIEYQNGEYHGSYRTFKRDGTIDQERYYVNGVLQPK